jgi:hypothetical protein
MCPYGWIGAANCVVEIVAAHPDVGASLQQSCWVRSLSINPTSSSDQSSFLFYAMLPSFQHTGQRCKATQRSAGWLRLRQLQLAEQSEDHQDTDHPHVVPGVVCAK